MLLHSASSLCSYSRIGSHQSEEMSKEMAYKTGSYVKTSLRITLTEKSMLYFLPCQIRGLYFIPLPLAKRYDLPSLYSWYHVQLTCLSGWYYGESCDRSHKFKINHIFLILDIPFLPLLTFIAFPLFSPFLFSYILLLV